MKKIILILFLAIFIFSNVNAQFTVNKIDGTPFTNNEVIEFTTHSSSTAELKFTVQNNSTDELDFRIRCTSLVNNNNSKKIHIFKIPANNKVYEILYSRNDRNVFRLLFNVHDTEFIETLKHINFKEFYIDYLQYD